MTEAAILVVFPLCLAMAAFSDLFTMTIPNRVSAILLATFVIIAPFAGLELPQISLHLLAGAIVFGLCFALFAANIMGGGDAKLLTASAVWFGLNPSLFTYLIYVSIFGGALTLVILALRKQENTLMATGLPLPPLLFTANKIPYGIAIGLGGFFAYPSSPLMLAALGHAQ
ncbi:MULTISPECIES: prepilin peptidase [unclassified Rhizobium]|uniref:A24 family peptidase n=1 Tax=unclassified Rhizobium TaxID=2613769 RepID=UPI0006FA639D|nr:MULTISPECIES: prepilin peptidase [unclassified Rhizobium]KQV44311.1 peptidase [Rhizobium sp. Root1212]KRD38492.1 peptidase [Rhizobium sp. Root268]